MVIETQPTLDYDAVVIGSGFGGSVAALRLAEKGYRVAVLEQGRRIRPEDMERANHSLRHLLWMPALGMKGFFTQTFFRHVNIAGGVGVGGGSLVYAAVLLEPGSSFFQDPSWSKLGIDWQRELKPHYQTAARMLGVDLCPTHTEMDNLLQQAAYGLGASSTIGAAPLGIFFDQDCRQSGHAAGEGAEIRFQPDPYFGGCGPQRAGCIACGRCLTGCPYCAKNTLDLNYLHLAEALGVQVLPEHKVTGLRPLPSGGYLVEIAHPWDHRRKIAPLSTKMVVIAAGVLGTLQLLFRCRDLLHSLPDLSPRLGDQVRTNSEALTGILSPGIETDLSRGPAISSHLFLPDGTHITQNRFPKGYAFMRWYTGPLVDGSRPLQRALLTLASILLQPRRSTASWWARNWHRRIAVLTVMQAQDNRLAFRFDRSLFNGFQPGLQTRCPDGKRAPTYLPQANQAARLFARASGGIPHNILMESLLNMSTTAHILGGAFIGPDRAHGVVDTNHQVFGYPDLYVVDGSAVPANVGVNPSLTITAMAERCLSLVPAKSD